MAKPKKPWVDFLPDPRPGHRTKCWTVVPRRDKETGGEADYAELGQVKWFSPWRRYCFFPLTNTIFDAACLTEIARFCGAEMLKHREAIDRVKAAKRRISRC
jgi:hypothetical protein